MKRLSEIENGGHFIYGGIEWVKIAHYGAVGGTAIASEPVFERAFDEQGYSFWGVSTLRRELNGKFLEAMLAEGAKLEAFESRASDLTANDRKVAYSIEEDKIRLIDTEFYIDYRDSIPGCEKPWWTLTPQTSSGRLEEGDVCYIDEYGEIMSCGAESKKIGVRPACNLNAQTLVIESEEERVRTRAETVKKATEDIMNTLCNYGTAIWSEVLTEVIKAIFAIKNNKERNNHEKTL